MKILPAKAAMYYFQLFEKCKFCKVFRLSVKTNSINIMAFVKGKNKQTMPPVNITLKLKDAYTTSFYESSKAKVF